MDLPSFAWYVCCFAICVSASDNQGMNVPRYDSHVLQLRDESIRNFRTDVATSRISSTEKIHLIRNYLTAKIPSQTLTLFEDTTNTFYGNIKRLWNVVADDEQFDADIMMFVHNETDCSLITTSDNPNETNSASLHGIVVTASTSNVSDGNLDCVDLAQAMINPENSIMLFTGRKFGYGSSAVENTAQGMTGKRIEFDVIWCGNEAGTPEEEEDYKQIATKTNGDVLEFTKIDQNSTTNEKKEHKTGNYTESNILLSDVEEILPRSTNFQGESADLLYDPKIGANSGRMIAVDENERRESMEVDDMIRSASLTINESFSRMERTPIEVTAATSLVGRPGGVSRLTFTVTNNYPVTIRHYFQARSSSFNVVYLEPRNGWIESGQSMTVVVDVSVSTTVSSSTTGTVTLVVQGIGSVEKSTYLYVRDTGSTIYDTTKPTINYSFNNNCAGKLGSNTCANNLWTVDVTIRDSDSGLQRVSSSPRGIQAASSFISGTRSATRFQYAGTCCQTSVLITAEDLLGNSNSETIEVTVWWNLSEGEIAAIVLGTLLLLLIIVVVILIVVCCVRKRRKSRDLPYTQRRQAVVQQN